MTRRTRSGHYSHLPYPRCVRLLLTYCVVALALTFIACVLIAF